MSGTELSRNSDLGVSGENKFVYLRQLLVSGFLKQCSSLFAEWLLLPAIAFVFRGQRLKSTVDLRSLAGITRLATD
jgi:hypothetical protein